MKKRLFSILVCLILVMSLLPTAALAYDTVKYDLWVGGVQVTSDNADNVLGNGTVSYEHITRTLTLKNAKITGATINESEDTVGIYSRDQLAIVLIGENSINSITVSSGESSAGICVAGDLLAIYGEGSLTVKAGDANNISYGIHADKAIKISEATVNAFGGDGVTSCGVHAKELTIKEGGRLYAQGSKASGATADIAAYSYGVEVSGEGGYAKVEDGYLYAQGGSVSGYRSRSYGFYGYYSSLLVTEDAVDSTVYAIGGDASGEDSCSYGIFVHGGNVGLLAGSTTARAGEAANSYGIYAQEYGKDTGNVIFQCDKNNISALDSRPGFAATKATISAAKNGTALHADGEVIISDTLTISGDEAAEKVDIELLTYKVTISGLKNSTLGIPVPAGWTLNETYCGEEFCNGYDSYYDALTASAEKEGYVFAGFTTENGKPYSFDTPVTEDIKLTAKWVEEPDDEIFPIVTLPSLGSSQGSDPSQLELMLTQYGSSADLDTGKYFTDVHPVDHWATEAIDYVVSRGIFSGTGANTFSPDAPMTRGMLAVVLYNLEGKPGHSYGGSFDDVAQGSWYEDAVYWAAEKGIVTGYGTGSFGPEDNITREQLAVMLYRYAQYKGYDTTQGGMAIREFSDFDSISEYAMQAMTWAVNTGLVGGYSDNTLAPQDTATRAQVAKMLMKFIQG